MTEVGLCTTLVRCDYRCGDCEWTTSLRVRCDQTIDAMTLLNGTIINYDAWTNQAPTRTGRLERILQ